MASGSGEPSFPDSSVCTVALSDVASGVCAFTAVNNGEPRSVVVAAGEAEAALADGACVPG